MANETGNGVARRRGEIYYNSANFGIAEKLSLRGNEYDTVATIRGEKRQKFTFAVFISLFLPLRFLHLPFYIYPIYVYS